jgi:DNA-binding MarR family transcriptional regulator
MATQPISNQSQMSIIHQLLLLARMIDQRTARDLLPEFRLKPAEWRVLSFACMNGTSTAAEICSAFATDPAGASRAVAGLLEENLIRRERDRRHRLRMQITPTRAGRDLFERARARWDCYSTDILQDLDPREHMMIHGALQSMADRVNEQPRTPRFTAGDAPCREESSAPSAHG